MKTGTTTIYARELWSNNYTCTSQQNVIGKIRAVRTLADVAEMLDYVLAEGIERRGCSGMGAGARLEVVIDGDPTDGDTDGIPISTISDVALRELNLPVGNVIDIGRRQSRMRRNQVWDGNNHVSPGSPSLDQLREEYF